MNDFDERQAKLEQDLRALKLEHAIYRMVQRITDAERDYAYKAERVSDAEAARMMRKISRRNDAMRRLVSALRRSPATVLTTDSL